MPSRFLLLPNARTSLSRHALEPVGEGSRLRLAYDLQISGAGVAVGDRERVEGELLGPGDVIGLDRRVITRVEPAEGLAGFEPTYMPFVEFVDADLPWRYSFDRNRDTRTTPWLVLIALAVDEFEFSEGSRVLPSIRVSEPMRSLPDLGQAWATAHVQADLAGIDDEDPEDALRLAMARSNRQFSRLLCPRRLSERTNYHLFLVPAYEAGRLSGLGQKGRAEPFDRPAWSADGSEPVELPFYFQQRFVTNALEDVERMLRRLRGLDAGDHGIGTPRLASASRPGYYSDYERPGASFSIQAALTAPGSPSMSFGTDQELADRLSSTLETVIRGEEVTSGRDGPDTEDPLVAMPPYGWRFRGDTSLSVPRARHGDWFHRVNLDLPFRHAAALGADTVRQNQDLFAKKCWEQYEDVVEANRALQRLRFALDLGRRIVDRRLSRLASDVVVRLSEPLHPYVRVPGAQPLSQSFRSNGTPTSFASRTMRRISAGRPVRDTGGAEPRRVVPVPALPGDIDRSPSPRPPLATSPGEARAEPRFRPGLEGRLEALFARGAFSGQSRARPVGVPVRSYRSGDLSDAVLNALRTLPLAKASVLVKRRTGSRSPVEPVYRSPSVPLPLSNWMGRMSTEHLLSGIERIPPDSVTVVTENRPFVEAFLVGANHEMNAELRWREFPTDMRGTIFRRFWDRGRPPDDRSGDEIADIHRWAGRLGSHFAPGDQDREADLVVVIRGSVVRKLGQLAVVLNEGVGDRWQRGVGVDHHPVFFGRPEPDLVYYGFDVARDHVLSPAVRDKAFLVLYEPIGRLRFGLDVARASVRRERLQYESVPLSFPTATLGRSYESVPPPRPDLERSIPDRPSDWDDLSWAHVARTASGYVDFNQSIEIAGAPGYWDSDRTSATIARSFWQKPLAVVLPLARVL